MPKIDPVYKMNLDFWAHLGMEKNDHYNSRCPHKILFTILYDVDVVQWLTPCHKTIQNLPMLVKFI